MPPLSDEQRDRLHYVHDMTRQLVQMLDKDDQKTAAALLTLATIAIRDTLSEAAAHSRVCGT